MPEHTPLLTSTPVGAYLRSLALTEAPKVDSWTACTELWRITDEHFVIIECDQDGHLHRGHEVLVARSIPPEWDCFASAWNQAGKWMAYHYGPVEDEVTN